MKNLFKILLGLIGVVILLMVGAAIVLPMIYDTDDLKRRIEAEVTDRTGRELVIAGDLGFSVFPWVAVEVADLSLGNAPGFDDGPFAQIGAARAGVALMPLLRKEIYVDEVQLSGLSLDLVVNEYGIGNWEDLAAGASEDAPADGGGPLASQKIAGVNISDARIGYRDERSGAAYRVSAFNLKTGALGDAGPVPVELAMLLEDLAAETAMNIRMAADAMLDPGKGVHTLDQLSLMVQQRDGPGLDLRATQAVADLNTDTYVLDDLTATIDQDGQRIELAAPRTMANLSAQTLEMIDFSARASGMDITGSLGAQQIMDAPAFAGSLKVAEFSPAAVMRELGLEPPPTADPGVLQRASLSADFDGDLDSVALTNLAMALDDSKLRGELSVRDLDQPRIRFGLDVDRIDLDRYMAPAAGDAPSAGQDEVAIPGEALAGLDVQGTLRVAALTAMGLELSDAEVGLQVADNRLRLHPLTAGFYGGEYSGDISLDASGDVPVISMDETIQAVIFRQLAGDLLGQDQLSGDGFGHVRLTGRGNTSGEVLRSLAGDIDLRLDEGALEGIDVWYEIRKAMAMIKGQPAPEDGQGRTVFSRLNFSAAVQDGVLNTRELVGQLPFIDLSGKGIIDIAQQAIDLDLMAAVRSVPELARDPLASDLQGKKLPLTISGSLTDPSIGVDLEGLLKAEATDMLMDKLGDKLGVDTSETGDFDSVEDAAAGLLSGLLSGKREEKPAAQEQAPAGAAEQAAPAQTGAEAEAAAAAAKEERKKARQEERKKQRQKEKDAEQEEEGG